MQHDGAHRQHGGFLGGGGGGGGSAATGGRRRVRWRRRRRRRWRRRRRRSLAWRPRVRRPTCGNERSGGGGGWVRGGTTERPQDARCVWREGGGGGVVREGGAAAGGGRAGAGVGEGRGRGWAAVAAFTSWIIWASIHLGEAVPAVADRVVGAPRRAIWYPCGRAPARERMEREVEVEVVALVVVVAARRLDGLRNDRILALRPAPRFELDGSPALGLASQPGLGPPPRRPVEPALLPLRADVVLLEHAAFRAVVPPAAAAAAAGRRRRRRCSWRTITVPPSSR